MERRVITEWDEGNKASVARCGATPQGCDRIIMVLAEQLDAAIWLDTVGSQKERYGVKRYVAVFRWMPPHDRPDLPSERYLRICFAIKYGRLRGLPKVVRVLCTHPIRERDSLLRETPPKRFIPAHPLLELLRP